MPYEPSVGVNKTRMGGANRQQTQKGTRKNQKRIVYSPSPPLPPPSLRLSRRKQVALEGLRQGQIHVTHRHLLLGDPLCPYAKDPWCQEILFQCDVLEPGEWRREIIVVSNIEDVFGTEHCDKVLVFLAESEILGTMGISMCSANCDIYFLSFIR